MTDKAHETGDNIRIPVVPNFQGRPIFSSKKVVKVEEIGYAKSSVLNTASFAGKVILREWLRDL